MHALSCFLVVKAGRATVHRACCTKKAPGIGHSTYHYVLDTQDGKQWNLELQRIATAPQIFVGKLWFQLQVRRSAAGRGAIRLGISLFPFRAI